MRLFLGVWRPGSGSQAIHARISAEQLKGFETTYRKRGLLFSSLDAYGDEFAAVWSPGKGVQFYYVDMSADEFVARQQYYFYNGFRLQHLSLDSGKFAAVWRTGTGAQHIEIGLSFDDFVAKNDVYGAQSERLMQLCVDDGSYTGVWRSGLDAGGEYFLSGTFKELDRQTTSLYDDGGLRLANVATDGASLFIGVWHPGSGAEHLFSAPWDAFLELHNACFHVGLRLTALVMHDGDPADFAYYGIDGMRNIDLPPPTGGVWQHWNPGSPVGGGTGGPIGPPSGKA